MKFIISFLMAAYCLPLNGYCQKKENTSVYIKVDAEIKDTLKIEYCNYGFGNKPFLPKSIVMSAMPRQVFRFDLKSKEPMIYFSLSSSAQDKVNKPLLNDFIIEPGDSITIKHQDGKLSFTGKGAAKYECIRDLLQKEKEWLKDEQLHPDERLKLRPADYSGKLDTNYLNYFPENLVIEYDRNHRLMEYKLSILQGYKSSLSAFLYNVIKANIKAANEPSKPPYESYLLSNKKDNISQEYKMRLWAKLTDLYNKREKASFTDIPVEALENSNKYLDYTILLYFNKSTISKSAINDLISKYSGTLRDRLLLLYGNSVQSSLTGIDSTFFEQALDVVRDPYCRNILLAMNEARGKGKPAYEFALPDTTGKIVRMSDLKGKTVIIDFYFTGCAGCKALAPHMKSIQGKMQHNPNFVFMSISIDKDRNEWRNSVRNHIYSEVGNIDLYTAGKWYYHPLIEHYGITRYPTLVVIDKEGKVFSRDLKTPFDDNSENEFIRILRSI